MGLVVSTHTVAIDAYIVKGRLEAEGIPAFLLDGQYITMDWSLSLALGGVKVVVPESYGASALEVLKLVEDDGYQISKLDREMLKEEFAGNFVPEIPLGCPKCDSFEISKVEWMRKLSLIMLFLFQIPIAFSQRFYSCDDCGHLFREGKRSFADFIFKLAFVLSVVLAVLMLFILPISDYQ